MNDTNKTMTWVNFGLLLILVFLSLRGGSSTSVADESNIDGIGSEPVEALELHTKEDAASLIAGLGDSPSAEEFATNLATIDGWISKPEEVEQLQAFKNEQLLALRKLVKNEVELLHEQALASQSGKEAGEFHAKASQALSLFPMDESKEVLAEAKALSEKHSEVGLRIDVIRRLRYNAWAMSRIEETIRFINSNASSFGTGDNLKLIDATVGKLSQVDPLLLEPVVAQLYNYALEQAKSNVTSEQQLELGRRLITPILNRKSYGDF